MNVFDKQQIDAVVMKTYKSSQALKCHHTFHLRRFNKSCKEHYQFLKKCFAWISLLLNLFQETFLSGAPLGSISPGLLFPRPGSIWEVNLGAHQISSSS